MERKKFILKLLSVGLFVLIAHALMIPLVDGSTLIYYHKCSSPKQENLIIGTSRASQALMPSVFKDSLDINIFNFAFNGTTSPYGKVYSHAIDEKLTDHFENSLFIICVDPWSISASLDSITGLEKYPEEGDIINDLYSFNSQPNIEFLAKEYQFGWGNIAYTRMRKNFSVIGHEDGWIEVLRDIDSLEMEKRAKDKISGMRETLKHLRISTARINELKNLIIKLKNRGEVYLVRLPVSETVFEIEKNFYPSFDSLITELATNCNSNYFQMQPLQNEMVFNDGHHINRLYSPKCTAKICSWIKKQRVES